MHTIEQLLEDVTPACRNSAFPNGFKKLCLSFIPWLMQYFPRPLPPPKKNSSSLLSFILSFCPPLYFPMKSVSCITIPLSQHLPFSNMQPTHCGGFIQSALEFIEQNCTVLHWTVSSWNASIIIFSTVNRGSLHYLTQLLQVQLLNILLLTTLESATESLKQNLRSQRAFCTRAKILGVSTKRAHAH